MLEKCIFLKGKFTQDCNIMGGVTVLDNAWGITECCSGVDWYWDYYKWDYGWVMSWCQVWLESPEIGRMQQYHHYLGSQYQLFVGKYSFFIIKIHIKYFLYNPMYAAEQWMRSQWCVTILPTKTIKYALAVYIYCHICTVWVTQANYSE